ncbi:MAG: putative rane protein [Bacteroidales bacterium]|jgi:putative membrane protein|nr:putative rane protein [Bacteroidales bacterium]
MHSKIIHHLLFFFKGFAMGAANVIPGVSGGTIALITGIFERLIDAIKSFNGTAFRLLIKGKIKEFIQYTDLFFLLSVFVGMVVSIVTLARLLAFLFDSYPIYIWAFFFGLIFASVYFVGKTITRWNISVIIPFIIGTALALSVTFLTPATQNDSFFYLVICGVVGICSMILPGLSGSFILILMGNYELVMIKAVNEMNISILFPVLIGAVAGLVLFSHILSWIYKKFKNQTIAILTGFILGSLSILWPWKNEIYRVNQAGDFILNNGEKIVQSYSLYIPKSLNVEVGVAIGFIILGILSIAMIEKFAQVKK